MTRYTTTFPFVRLRNNISHLRNLFEKQHLNQRTLVHKPKNIAWMEYLFVSCWLDVNVPCPLQVRGLATVVTKLCF